MSKVVDTIEDGKRVFKKIQESLDEKLFYDKQYFAKIGFPDAEVEERKLSPDGMMKGGYYDNTEKLTQPFRKFVEFVQGPGSRITYTEQQVDKSVTTEPSSGSGFIEILSGYNNQVFKYLKDSFDNIGSRFKRSPNVEQTKGSEIQDSKETTGVGSNISTSVEPLTKIEGDGSSEEPHATEQTTSTEQSEEKMYWIVRIPIIEDEVPKNKYDKAEAKLMQILREEKVDKSLGKSKVGEIYEVGNRYVRICESVKEYAPYDIEDTDLQGSLMKKFKVMRDRG